MKDSYTVYFTDEENKMIHDNTEESDGILKLQTGETAGVATSVSITTDYTVTECELRRFENYNTEDDRYYVSADGGENWEEYTASEGKTHKFEHTGSSLQFRISMERASAGATSPQYESISLLYKG